MGIAGPYANAWARRSNSALTFHHYLHHWVSLLNVEELRMIGDIKDLDVHNICFNQCNVHPNLPCVRCTVLLPGVDEQRPFLSVGMILRCRAATGRFVYEFSGYVVDRKGICVHVDFLKKDFLALAKALTGAKINTSRIDETESTSK